MLRKPVVESIGEADLSETSLWLSCHGYESRSICHLDWRNITAKKKLSFGFDFPIGDEAPEAVARVLAARERLESSEFDVFVTDELEFERRVNIEIDALRSEQARIVADISSMSRGRIASLLLACARRAGGCQLDLIYFPALFSSHKHEYEPLEHFGPCHRYLAGWPNDSDLPRAMVVGLGTEPRRGDGVVEMLEPDILALFFPVGDEPEYETELRSENKRLLEVGGQSMRYSIRDPLGTYSAISAVARDLSSRSRLVVVPLGPKIFTALSIIGALNIGLEVGIWRASAGRGVQPIDVVGADVPVLTRVIFKDR